VRTLQRLGVPAAFFMVGSQVAAAPATGRTVQRAGLLIGNQTYNHERLTTLSDARIRATLRATQRVMRTSGLHPSHLMRPPYGAIDARVRRVVHGLGLVPVLWDVDPRDWAGGSARTIARRVLAGLRPHLRNIVLQHDGVQNSPATIAAVPRIVRVARSRGYCFVALDEHGQPATPA
jgi:peptidoglycan/xylan/chitin deacetylase (PgdA/CDA1 family)